MHKEKIIYRGKRISDRAWVYGSVVSSTNDKTYIVHGATEGAVNTNNSVDFYYTEVDPKTVCAGCLIEGETYFEHDLIKISGDDIERPEVAEVYFDKGSICICYDFGEYDITTVGWAKEYCECGNGCFVVVGNTFDGEYKREDAKEDHPRRSPDSPAVC